VGSNSTDQCQQPADNNEEFPKMTLRNLPIFIIATGMLLSLPAAAAPPWQDGSGHGYSHEKEKHKRRYKHKHKHEREYGAREDDEYGGYRDRSGPPPWAPAHGYRRKHQYEDNDTVIIVNRPPAEEPVYAEPQDDAVQFRTASQQIGISSGRCNREVVGTVVGGIVGGVIGNKLVHDRDKKLGTAAGVIIGAIVGNQIGRNMDDADANCTNQTLERAPDGQVVHWKNPDTGYQYAVTPYKSYQRDDGRYCRDYTTVVQSSKTNQYRQTACRSDQGLWEKQ
jgi:surface antigen